MRAFRIGFLLLVLGLPAAFAQVNDTYVIPAAGNVPGQFGTYWKTQFSLFNPQSYALVVSMTFIPEGGAQGTEKLVNVPRNALAFYDDVIHDVYGFTNVKGALLVATFPEDQAPTVPDTVIARSFIVTTNTYTEDPTTHGIYGQTIPGAFGTFLQDFSVDNITAVAHGIRNDASQSWRANIGALNLGRSSVRMLVSVFDFDGNTVQQNIPLDIPPMAQWQQQLPVNVNPGSVEFSITNDALKNDPNQRAVVFPYVSVVDDISGDPQYQAPVLLAAANVVFKSAAATAQSDRRITTEIARRVRQSAIHLGEVKAQLKTGTR